MFPLLPSRNGCSLEGRILYIHLDTGGGSIVSGTFLRQERMILLHTGFQGLAKKAASGTRIAFTEGEEETSYRGREAMRSVSASEAVKHGPG
jgi:hypothetical protein